MEGLIYEVYALLELNHVGCLHALGSFDDFEGDRLTFRERLESILLYGGIMHEYDLAIISVNKSKTS